MKRQLMRRGKACKREREVRGEANRKGGRRRNEERRREGEERERVGMGDTKGKIAKGRGGEGSREKVHKRGEIIENCEGKGREG